MQEWESEGVNRGKELPCSNSVLAKAGWDKSENTFSQRKMPFFLLLYYAEDNPLF